MSQSTATTLSSLTTGDRVLYNQKKTPLSVVSVEAGEVLVEGPQGGEYLLFQAPDNPDIVLESKSGNKEYASKVTDLRIVGEWVQDGEDVWEHSQTEAIIKVVKTDAGYWTIEITNFEGELPDIPLYGFMKKSIAREEAKHFMSDNPEG